MGRSLAICFHPMAAWRSSSQRKRLVLVSGYVSAGYIVTLIALRLLSAPSTTNYLGDAASVLDIGMLTKADSGALCAK